LLAFVEAVEPMAGISLMIVGDVPRVIPQASKPTGTKCSSLTSTGIFRDCRLHKGALDIAFRAAIRS
jgi:hypothetical protein